MNIAFTGARRITAAQYLFLLKTIDHEVPQGSTLVTGACSGVDAAVARIGKRLGYRVLTVVPGNLKEVDPDWRAFCDGCLEMPSMSTYRQRNERMVALADRLIGFPVQEEHHTSMRRSGTWMTIRLARRKGIPTTVHVLCDSA